MASTLFKEGPFNLASSTIIGHLSTLNSDALSFEFDVKLYSKSDHYKNIIVIGFNDIQYKMRKMELPGIGFSANSTKLRARLWARADSLIWYLHDNTTQITLSLFETHHISGIFVHHNFILNINGSKQMEITIFPPNLLQTNNFIIQTCDKSCGANATLTNVTVTAYDTSYIPPTIYPSLPPTIFPTLHPSKFPSLSSSKMPSLSPSEMSIFIPSISTLDNVAASNTNSFNSNELIAIWIFLIILSTIIITGAIYVCKWKRKTDNYQFAELQHETDDSEEDDNVSITSFDVYSCIASTEQNVEMETIINDANSLEQSDPNDGI